MLNDICKFSCVVFTGIHSEDIVDSGESPGGGADWDRVPLMKKSHDGFYKN